MSDTATSLWSVRYIESRLKPVKPAAVWDIAVMCAQTLATRSVGDAEPPDPPRITHASPNADFAGATTSQRIEHVKPSTRPLSSFGNVDGKGDKEINKTGDAATTAEVLQADANEAKDQDQDQRR